jgi:Acetyl-CoA hydrolase
MKALIGRAPELTDVEITHILTLGKTPYADPEFAGHIRVNTMFIGEGVRGAVNEGRADFTPVRLSEVPKLFSEGIVPLDVAFIHVTPPDEHGFCSYGVEISTNRAAAAAAKLVVAEINPQMPRTLGDAFIHISRIHRIVPVDYPIFQTTMGTPSELSMRIGKHVAGLIEDGSTMQMGIGAIPDGVLYYLKDKKDLGIHTEMFSDGVVELYEKGVVTGEKKNIDRGRSSRASSSARSALRLRRQQPGRRDAPDGVRQRPVRHPPERPDGRDQLRDRGRPDGPGLRRLDRPAALLRSRRAARLHPRRGPLARRQADHRPPLERHGEGQAGLHADRADAQARRGVVTGRYDVHYVARSGASRTSTGRRSGSGRRPSSTSPTPTSARSSSGRRSS